jgi:hypothetical protein
MADANAIKLGRPSINDGARPRTTCAHRPFRSREHSRRSSTTNHVRAPSVQLALDVLDLDLRDLERRALAVLDHDLDLRDLERRALDVLAVLDLDDRINRRPSSPS